MGGLHKRYEHRRGFLFPAHNRREICQTDRPFCLTNFEVGQTVLTESPSEGLTVIVIRIYGTPSRYCCIV